MKKIATVALLLGAMYTNANAMEVKPYVGVETSFTMSKIDNSFLTKGDGAIDDNSNKFNAGLNGGLQFDVNDKFYFGGEIYLNTGKMIDESKGEHYDLGREDYGDSRMKVKLNQIFGFRANAGYNFNDKISTFAFIGLNYNKYESQFNDKDTGGEYFNGKHTEKKVTPSFGLGVAYNFTKNLQANLSYEFSKFTISDNILGAYQYYWEDNIKKDVDIMTNTFRLGVKYLF